MLQTANDYTAKMQILTSNQIPNAKDKSRRSPRYESEWWCFMVCLCTKSTYLQSKAVLCQAVEDAEKLLDSRRFRFCCAAGLLLRARSIRPSTPTCLPDDNDAWMRFILIRARVLQWFHVLSTIQDSNCWGLHHLLENEFTWPLWPAESHESIKPPPSLPSLVDRHAAMILLLTSNEYRAPSLQMTVGGLEMPQRTRS